jgi:hypothetical protein
VPDGLDAVIRRAMAKRPEDRYASAGDLARAALAAASGSRRPWRIPRRLVAGALGLLAAGAIATAVLLTHEAGASHPSASAHSSQVAQGPSGGRLLPRGELPGTALAGTPAAATLRPRLLGGGDLRGLRPFGVAHLYTDRSQPLFSLGNHPAFFALLGDTKAAYQLFSGAGERGAGSIVYAFRSRADATFFGGQTQLQPNPSPNDVPIDAPGIPGAHGYAYVGTNYARALIVFARGPYVYEEFVYGPPSTLSDATPALMAASRRLWLRVARK